MPTWFAAFMGFVQGMTEYLPVSSTAHLRIAPTLLGEPDPGAAYTAVLQLGTLAAVIIYFAKDLVRMPLAAIKDVRSPDAMLMWKIGLGSIPIGVLGILLKHHIESDFRSLWIIACSLIGVGVLVAVIDARAKGERGAYDLGWLDAFLIGCAQSCALIPGVSRSGSTICMALLLGMSRREAARFSFLLGIPAVGAAGVFELKDAIHQLHSDALVSLAVGIAVAGVVGYASIAWLLRFLSTHRLWPFAVYRTLLGIAILVLFAS